LNLVQPESTLETSRLLLEPIHSYHAVNLYEPLQSPAIYEFIPEDPPASLEALTTRYQKLSARISSDGQELWLNWDIRLRNEKTYVGVLQATIYSDATAYLAYILFPPFWKQGYASEGCRRILELLFTDYRVRIVIAEIDTRNTASMKLVEHLGFQRVGTKLDADFFKGSTSHEYRYEILSPDQAG
jgi:RimJ/RimL family protein N-acetyltransferase